MTTYSGIKFTVTVFTASMFDRHHSERTKHVVATSPEALIEALKRINYWHVSRVFMSKEQREAMDARDAAGQLGFLEAEFKDFCWTATSLQIDALDLENAP